MTVEEMIMLDELSRTEEEERNHNRHFLFETNDETLNICFDGSKSDSELQYECESAYLAWKDLSEEPMPEFTDYLTCCLNDIGITVHYVQTY